MAETNSSGTVVKSYIYDAFGVEQNPSDSDTNPFRYCGEYYDIEIGQIYLRARYYNPSIGRFTQSDPAMADGMNWYVYCGNDPINFWDLTGRIKEGDKEKYGENSTVYKAILYLGDAWQIFPEYRTEIEEVANEIRYLANSNGSGYIDNVIKALRKVGQLPENLNYVEQVLVAGYPIDAMAMDSARQEADRATWEIFGEAGNGDGEANAFKHAYWNAVATQKIGSKKARLFANAHEFGWVWENASNPIPMKMDLHNNSMGQMIGSSNLYKDDIKSWVLRLQMRGQLLKIVDGKLVPTNANAQFLPG